MFEIKQNNDTNYSKEPGLRYFKNEISTSEHIYRQNNVTKIRNHLLRNHKVSERLRNTFIFKGKTFTPAAILLQGIKSVINFHAAYLVGNPVTITGTPDAVALINKYYKNGIYSSVDWRILNDLITYGNAFEYVYLDDNGNIKSKVFRNQDSYPIYDENMEYSYFVEHWKNKRTNDDHYTIYYPTHVDSYINNRLISSKTNYSGLPIHYAGMERGDFDQFGDSIILDLIPIQDKIEGLLSKLDDAITTLSLNPIGVVIGARITEKDMIESSISGAVLNLEEGGDFKYVNAEMDYNSIKFEMDQLYQQFNLVAGVPSSLLGQSNVSNVSENSMSMIYQTTENRGKQNMNSLIEGFRKRWDYMRKLLSYMNITISDEDFNSLDVSFNVNKPTDTKQNMENMKMQYEMGALSRTSIMEQSPYTTDSAQELQRLEDEGKPVDGNSAGLDNNTDDESKE